MKIINYLSSVAVPMIILLIVVYGLKDKNKVYDCFIDGAQEGIGVVVKIFPTLIGLFVAVGALRASGIIDLLVKFITPLINVIKIPAEIVPLIVVRPISGSASIAVATEIMQNYGVDNIIGIIASCIMGSTETTLYAITIYTSSVGIKKIRYVLVASLLADVVGIIVSIIMCNLFFN